jgi:hypothetical protein
MVPLAIVLGTVASYAVGWAAGFPPLFPVLNTLAAFPFMFTALRQQRTRLAIARMLIWAATMGVSATTMAYLAPQRTAHLFINADAYQREMFTWVLTGIGPESTPSEFVPLHLRHAALFVVLSLLTGSVLSMPMGAVLMNYMGHYVGALAARSASPMAVLILGWHPWAVIRIASFVVLGVVLGGPVLARIGGFKSEVRAQAPWIALAVGGILLDLLVKWLLAPTWQQLLLRAVQN